MTTIQHLRNDEIHELLISLNKDEVTNIKHAMEKTFEDFSVGGERPRQPDPCSSNRPDGRRILYRGFSSDLSVGAKIVVESPVGPDGVKNPLRGIVVLMDGLGVPKSIMDAEEVTGYRTSMNAMVPFSWRKNVGQIVIFGTGMQALWHSRLIIQLKGSEVSRITYVSGSKSRALDIIATISAENQARWEAPVSFDFLVTTTSSSGSDGGENKEDNITTLLNTADCVFCTTPSTSPLFKANQIGQRLEADASRKPLISAVGSWQADMIELDPELLRLVVNSSDRYNPQSGASRGALLVDDRDFAMESTGELVRSKCASSDVVELGYIIAMLNGSVQSVDGDGGIERTRHMISEGFVIYKSIGVSTTDLAMCNAIQNIRQKTM